MLGRVSSSCFLYEALIKASFSPSAGTQHTHRDFGLEYDVIFQAELIVSGAQFSLSGCCRTLHCYTMQPWMPGNALMKTYEKLDVSWLWREECREDTERWKMGVKQKRVRSEA